MKNKHKPATEAARADEADTARCLADKIHANAYGRAENQISTSTPGACRITEKNKGG